MSRLIARTSCATAILAAALTLAGCTTTTDGGDRLSIGAPSRAAVSETGLPADAVVNRSRMSGKEIVFFQAARVTPEQLTAAPAHICAAKGQRVAATEVKDPHHPDQLPGVRILTVRCAA